jgi:hypothetical protein
VDQNTFGPPDQDQIIAQRDQHTLNLVHGGVPLAQNTLIPQGFISYKGAEKH